MSKNNFTELPSEIYFMQINRHIHYAEACAEIYFLLKYKNAKYENEKWDQVLKIAPVFFTVTRKALLEMSLLNLSGICESYQKTAKFIDSQNGFLNTEDKIKHYQLCKAKMKEGAALLHGIDKIRDKTIAHFDPVYFENANDLYQEVNPNIDDLRKLISLLKEINMDLTKLIFNNTEDDCLLIETEEDYYALDNFDDVAKLMDKCLK